MPGVNMSKKNIVYLDTNIILRFLIGEGGELADKAKDIFKKIESGDLTAFCNDAVFAEIVFVLQKVYNVEKNLIKESLENIIYMSEFYVDNKEVALKALTIFVENRIDIVDSLLIAYNNVSDINVLSFDKKLNNMLKT